MYAYVSQTKDGAWRVQQRVRAIMADQYRSDAGVCVAGAGWVSVSVPCVLCCVVYVARGRVWYIEDACFYFVLRTTQ